MRQIDNSVAALKNATHLMTVSSEAELKCQSKVFPRNPIISVGLDRGFLMKLNRAKRFQEKAMRIHDHECAVVLAMNEIHVQRLQRYSL